MRPTLRRLGLGLMVPVFACAAFVWWQARQRFSETSWFQVQAVAPGVWRIDDHGGDNIYLVAGETRALLVDTGTGAADLAACVRGLTTLPLTVVNTHGHPDHAGGDHQFAAVGAHPDDFDAILRLVSRGSGAGRRAGLLRRLLGFGPPRSATGGAFDRGRLEPVTAGHVFDLGGRRLEVLETPGHTPGSVCLLDGAHRLLFAGDNDNTLAWLFLENSLPLEVYLRTLQGLQARAGQFDTILPGHGPPLDVAFLGEQIACAESILSGACAGEPYHNPFGIAARRCSFKRAGIAFDPKKLRQVGALREGA